MPTVQDLGQAIKKRYPGQYDDVDDAKLGQIIKQKYPGEYDDFEELGATPRTLTDQLRTSPVGEYVKETAKNLPGSAFELGKGALKFGASLTPYGTMEAGKGLAEASRTPKESLENVVKTGQGIGEYYGERFSNPLETFKQDPVGMAADASIPLNIAGVGLRAGGLSRAAGALGRAGAAVDPVTGAGRLAARASGPSRQAVGEWLYGRSLGPLPKELRGERSRLAQTGLKNQVPLNTKGLEKIEEVKRNLYPKIDSIIQQLEESGEMVDQMRVLEELRSVVDDFSTAAPSRDLASIKYQIGDFIKHYGSPSVTERRVPVGGRGANLAEEFPYVAKEGPQNEPFWWMDLPDEPQQIYPANALPSANKSQPGVETIPEQKRLASGRELPPGRDFISLPPPEEGQIFDASGRPSFRIERFLGPNVPGMMSPRAAQTVKSRTYGKVGNRAYTEGLKSSEVESLKGIARGLRAELERLAGPESGLKQFNTEYGDLLDLENLVADKPVDWDSPLLYYGLQHPWMASHGVAKMALGAGPRSNLAISLAPGRARTPIPAMAPFMSPTSRTQTAIEQGKQRKKKDNTLGR